MSEDAFSIVALRDALLSEREAHKETLRLRYCAEDDSALLKAQYDALLQNSKAELAAERAECLEQSRLNGMGAERELKLMAHRDSALAALEVVREKVAFIGNVAHAEGDTAGICDHVVEALAAADAVLGEKHG